MKLPIRLKARSFAFRTGLVLAGLHFLFVSVSIIDMMHNPGEPRHMFRRLPAYLDFPVSLLIPWVIQPIHSALFSIHRLYLSERLLRFVTFSVFHLVVGSIWYFHHPANDLYFIRQYHN